jgi:predicted nucleic acid-binding protein
LRAVLDPNVLVSAAISPTGPPREIVTAWVEGRFELIASPALTC